MCGIAGIVDLGGGPVLPGELRRMCDVMRHRGPDDEGIYLGAGAGLGMRRLSIIDLDTGRQPIHNEDKTVWVVLNGEIYNFRDLRKHLTRRGHAFSTQTDTETIVHLYEEYGDRCVDHLRGMFAFALWDEKSRRLLLARDRLGVKPLYYAEIGGRLVFASELKALLELPDVEPEIDWPAASHLFTFLTTPVSGSIVRGVRKLPAAHLLVAAAGRRTRVHPYWDVQFYPDRGRSAGDLIEELRTLLDESVRLRLVSDVPVGAFLSGGLDSSAVVATMAPHVQGPLKTFTIGFADQAYDESAHARRVARQFGTDHHELILEPDVTDQIEDIAWHLDEPFGDSSAIPTYMVSKLAAEHVKVVLSGDGGDEIFAGYERYVVEARRRAFRLPRLARRIAGRAAGRLRPGAKGRNFLHNLGLDGAHRYLDESTLFRRDDLERLFPPEVLDRMGPHNPSRAEHGYLEHSGGHWLSAARYLDLKSSLPLDILTKVDRMSMAHSLEAREPLLDHRLVEFAAAIPPGMLLRDGTTKWIFKEAMRGILPDDIIDRRKQGFAIPLGRWFRGKLGGFVHDLLLTKRSRERGFFNPAAVEDLVRSHEAGRSLDLQIWTLLSFELWCRAFIDARPARQREVACVSL
ncbi:MAG TPA: asparagine synthase (glutamine-hydrolyzing) [Candidatus Polarisedimenticolia bacterium]|nr:asparagine synthase (glutamine-hydrolyzing) [Candidatus Polarisedimenticolia bacterium]